MGLVCDEYILKFLETHEEKPTKSFSGTAEIKRKKIKGVKGDLTCYLDFNVKISKPDEVQNKINLEIQNDKNAKQIVLAKTDNKALEELKEMKSKVKTKGLKTPTIFNIVTNHVDHNLQKKIDIMEQQQKKIQDQNIVIEKYIILADPKYENGTSLTSNVIFNCLLTWDDLSTELLTRITDAFRKVLEETDKTDQILYWESTYASLKNLIHSNSTLKKKLSDFVDILEELASQCSIKLAKSYEKMFDDALDSSFHSMSKQKITMAFANDYLKIFFVALKELNQNYVNHEGQVAIFSKILTYINDVGISMIVKDKSLCVPDFGLSLKMTISKLEKWFPANKFGNLGREKLAPIRQVSDLLSLENTKDRELICPELSFDIYNKIVNQKSRT